MKKYILSLAFLAFTGCAVGKSPLLSAPYVTANSDDLIDTKHAKDLGPVSARYCPGDPSSHADASSIGLMDEAIYLAQKEKNATYIRDAQFYTQGTCVVLEGIAMKTNQ